MKHDESYGFLIDRISEADLLRWKRKAKKCFNPKMVDRETQLYAALDLAGDVFRKLDPEGWKR